MVSIIIPVYNCENYLHMSISSLINQTIFNNLELIFVDDGSTDNSREIINEYVHVYSNMKLITQENSGVSVARNNGIKHSNGDFISFFDADDIAEPALYETLQSLLIDNNADISVINYNMVFENGVSKKHKSTLKKIYNSKNEALKSFFTENFICTNPVDKMFSRQVVDKISFPEGFAIGEDMFFVYKAICAADKLVIDTTNSLYNYCLHSDSAMKTHFRTSTLMLYFYQNKF